ncbi:hypothetical protein WJX77_002407 [Trebouxia sp. C0004]
MQSTARHMLSEAREALAANTASAGSASEQQQIMERLLSHHEAGTTASGREGCTPDPSPQHQLRAQKLALSLLSRGVRLPQSVLDSVGNVAKSRAGDPSTEPTARRETATVAHAVSSLPTVRQTKAKAIDTRQAARLQELESLPEHLPAHVKLKALIEHKRLKLQGLQQKLRNDVALEQRLLKDCSPSVLMDWTRCKRADPEAAEPNMNYKEPAPPASLVPKPSQAAQIEIARQRMEQARVQEETQVRADHSKRLKLMRHALEEEKKKRMEDNARLQKQLELKQRMIQERRAFLSELFVYHRDLVRPAVQKAQRARALRNSHVKAFHRRQGDKVTREQNARIAALKEDNYEEYLKLAANTKNQRLRTLLEKTGSIIEELGLKVHDQRSATTAEEEGATDIWLDGVASSSQEESGLASQARHMIQGQRQYYDEVHVIKEQVEAPAMLVGGTLRHYQLGGLKFLMSLYNNNMNGILADEMGLGKTIQTISFLASLMEKKDNMGPHIILAPKAVLSNWGQEFVKWAPDMAVVMYDGSPDERKQLQRDRLEKGTFNVLVTHYDLVMRDKAALRKVQWDLLIVDEGHRLKNAESRLAEILRSYRFKHRVLLTGTPIQNSLGELWSLLNFVLPRVFNSSETFDEWFAAPFRGQSEDLSEQLNEEEQLLVISRLHQVLRPFMLRRTKREVEKELPSKTEHVVKCAMSAWQNILYQQITDKGRIRGDDKAMRSLQNTAMHLRKTCNHPYLFLDPSYQPAYPEELIRASGKLELLDNILPKLQATGHRVLLFSQMTRALDMVEDFLLLRSFSYLRLDGRTKADARTKMLEDFNKPDSPYFIFALSTRAGGLGLNLQTADTVIMFDSDWNPQMDQQAEDRAHRIGQKKEVVVLVLVSAGTIEQVILDRAQQKKEIDAKVIQAGMFNDKSTHNERQEALQTVMRKGDADVGEQVHSPAQLNKLLARSTEEFNTFQQMDESREAAAEGTATGLLTVAEVPSWVTHDAANDRHQSVEEESGDEAGSKRRKRRSSNAGVQYSEDLSDAMFNRLMQPDDHSESASEEEVLPARRVSKSKDATPVVSDSEEAPDPADASQPPNAPQSHAQTQPATKKGKLRKAAATQQDELQEQGSARKRRKQSSSKTPEPSEAVQQPASSQSQGDNVSDKKSSGAGQKLSGSSREERSAGKLPKAATRSPAPRPQKAPGQKKGQDSGQSQPASGTDGANKQTSPPPENRRGSRTRS